MCLGFVLVCDATERNVSILLYMDGMTEFQNTCGLIRLVASGSYVTLCSAQCQCSLVNININVAAFH
jgi:hypothetical protein